MDKNLCDTVITTSLYWENAVTIHPEHCDNRIRLRETVFSLPHAYPVRAQLKRVLSWVITKRVERGLYASLQDEARANYTRPDRGCPRASEELRQFGLHNLGAPIFFLLVIVTMLSAARTWVGDKLHCISMPSPKATAVNLGRVCVKRLSSRASSSFTG